MKKKQKEPASPRTFVDHAGHKHTTLKNTIPQLYDCRCGAKPGESHAPSGCDYEICWGCGRISCECDRRSRRKTVWRGEYPGAAECREFGFFCYQKPLPNGGWRWTPCDAEQEGATEDVMRLQCSGEAEWNPAVQRWVRTNHCPVWEDPNRQ